MVGCQLARRPPSPRKSLLPRHLPQACLHLHLLRLPRRPPFQQRQDQRCHPPHPLAWRRERLRLACRFLQAPLPEQPVHSLQPEAASHLRANQHQDCSPCRQNPRQRLRPASQPRLLACRLPRRKTEASPACLRQSPRIARPPRRLCPPGGLCRLALACRGQEPRCWGDQPLAARPRLWLAEAPHLPRFSRGRPCQPPGRRLFSALRQRPARLRQRLRAGLWVPLRVMAALLLPLRFSPTSPPPRPSMACHRSVQRRRQGHPPLPVWHPRQPRGLLLRHFPCPTHPCRHRHRVLDSGSRPLERRHLPRRVSVPRPQAWEEGAPLHQHRRS